jgi:hypothetical protein
MKKLSHFEIVSSNIPTAVTAGITNLHTSKMLARKYNVTERSQVTVVATTIRSYEELQPCSSFRNEIFPSRQQYTQIGAGMYPDVHNLSESNGWRV